MSREPALYGRERELTHLRHLLDDVAQGTGRALVVAGARGVGKSAVLRQAATMAAPSVRILRAAGAADEAGLAYATIQQLCMPVLDEAERLPEPQRDALLAALGMRAGPAPEPFLVGLGVLGLLSNVAGRDGVLCLIDDAHWMDAPSAGVLRFVTRRMGSFGVGLVVAASGDAVDGLLEGAQAVELAELSTSDARALLRRHLTGPVDARVEARIVAETRGNPAALIEFGRNVAPLELAGGFGVPRFRTPPSRRAAEIEDRVAALRPQQRRLVTIAAADPTGDPALLRAAAWRLGIPPDLLETDTVAGLVEVADTVRFPNPLVRSAVYDAARAEERRDAHQALAEVIVDPADADWRAWHRSAAAAERDSALASELEAVAATAQQRGGLPAAALFWERAATLSGSASQRARRALGAAELKHRAGDSAAALRLLATAEPWLAQPDQRERAQLLRARAAYALNLDDEVPPPLRRAAARLETLDRRIARDAHVEALTAVPTPLRAVSDGDAGAAVDELAAALATLDNDGFAAGAPAVRAALARYRSEVHAEDDALRWDWLACRAAAYVWEFPTVDTISARMVQLPRDLGALRALPLGLAYRMVPLVLRGEIAAAAALGAELHDLAPTRLTLPLATGELHVRAWRGREREANLFIDRLSEQAAAQGETMGVAAAGMARAVLYNGLGLPDLAFDAARQGASASEGTLFQNLSLPELVEAAVRCRRWDVAEEAMGALAERTAPAGSEWARGVELRGRALVAGGDEAESLYRRSIGLLEASDVRTEHARSLLVFGEWLRRRRRRAEARSYLRAARTMFLEMGMEAFATRAEREIAAVGDSPRRGDPAVHLTARELEIARLASEGFSNPEIGTRLYLSARTVQYHLRKVFMKLAISSRVQLAGALEAIGADRTAHEHALTLRAS